MHKKKNSASVLAGEMILTFYKPPKVRNTANPAKTITEVESAAILPEVFDSCMGHDATSFTSEALFNRLSWNCGIAAR